MKEQGTRDQGAWAGCEAVTAEASRIKRMKLKARERVSLMSMALAVLWMPIQGVRLRLRQDWVALRNSA